MGRTACEYILSKEINLQTRWPDFIKTSQLLDTYAKYVDKDPHWTLMRPFLPIHRRRVHINSINYVI